MPKPWKKVRNKRIHTLIDVDGWSYRKVARKYSLDVSTVFDIVVRSRERMKLSKIARQ